MSSLDFPAPLDREKFSGSKEAPKPPGRRESAPKPSSGGRKAPLEKRLLESISGVGLMVAMVNEVDGLAILQGAERLSVALDKAAKQSPAVARALEAALTGGVWAEVAFASGAIILPIALNHHFIPASLTGFVGMPSVEVSPSERNGDHPSE